LSFHSLTCFECLSLASRIVASLAARPASISTPASPQASASARSAASSSLSFLLQSLSCCLRSSRFATANFTFSAWAASASERTSTAAAASASERTSTAAAASILCCNDLHFWFLPERPSPFYIDKTIHPRTHTNSKQFMCKSDTILHVLCSPPLLQMHQNNNKRICESLVAVSVLAGSVTRTPSHVQTTTRSNTRLLCPYKPTAQSTKSCASVSSTVDRVSPRSPMISRENETANTTLASLLTGPVSSVPV
jgi:hypothetical protein